MAAPSVPNRPSSTWLAQWEPENPSFWESTGKRIAWRTLWITAYSLMLSFMGNFSGFMPSTSYFYPRRCRARRWGFKPGSATSG